jgi:hypothetical protein
MHPLRLVVTSVASRVLLQGLVTTERDGYGCTLSPLNTHCVETRSFLISAPREIALELEDRTPAPERPFPFENNDVPRRAHITLLLAVSFASTPFGSAQTVSGDLDSGPPVSQRQFNSWPDLTRLPPLRPPALETDPANPTRIGFRTTPYSAAPPIQNAVPDSVQGETFELAETVAQVGDQYILKGDLFGEANLMMSPMWAQLEKVPPEQRERARQELLEYRRQLVENQLLAQAIDRKLKYLAFLRQLPTEPDAKKAEERRKKIQETVVKRFDEDLDKMIAKLRDVKPEDSLELARQNQQIFRLAAVMKESGILTRENRTLDLLLKKHGTTLAKQQQAFLEHALGQSAISQKVNFQPDITHEQMLAYYHEHEGEYHVPFMAKWEQLSVLFTRVSDMRAAHDLINGMGNEVLFGGAPLWAVAQRKSQEKNAAKGGYHDWTNFGDLKISRPINDAVFSIPLNELSRVIQDDEGLHIIRVLDRQEAHLKPFEDVQDDIKEKLRSEALNKAYAEYVKKLREQTPIITNSGTATPTNRMAKPPPRNEQSR